MKTIRLGPRLAEGLIILLATAGIFCQFLSPNAPDAQNLSSFYAPPTRLHFFDPQGRFHLRPFFYHVNLRDPIEGSYEEQTDMVYPLEFFVEGWSYRILGSIPASTHLVGSNSGGQYYPLGTDGLGRDVLARTLAGARTSLLVVIVGISLYAILGVAVGITAGSIGGWVDSVLMRLSEFVLALPALYLILAMRAILPLEMPFFQTLILLVGTIAFIAWPPMARGVRGLVLQLRSAGFVEAARSLGGKRWHLFIRHIFPTLAPFVLTQTALAAPLFILGEVLLSFLGVGFQDESWGSMLQSEGNLGIITDFWWNLAPLGFIFATLLCLNILSSGRRTERLNRIPL